MKRVFKTKRFENNLMISLLGFSLILLVCHHFFMNKVISINSATNLPINIIDDSVANGGSSSSSLQTKDNKFILNCHIVRDDYAWPFCEISFAFYNDEKALGVNLSNFDSISISAKYIGENTSGIRFQLRSFNSDYGSLNDQETWKYNAIEYWPEKNSSLTMIPMNGLQVSTWWLLEQKIPIQYSAPEFENVMVIEIATGSNIAEGQYLLAIENISFHGKYFKQEHVYLLLLVCWIVSAMTILFIRVKKTRRHLAQEIKTSKELRQLNELLNVETKNLKEQSELDPLTGVFNRVGIQPIFTQEIKVISLIFIDIDHFKNINDSHGHNFGDEILKTFAQLIKECSRKTDFLVRWGGEEFLLVCPNTPLEKAHMFAEDLRLLVEKYNWPKTINLTASFGVAQRKDESSADFIERADKALYAAKREGRNKVVVAENH